MTLVGARLAGRFDVRERLRELPGHVELRVFDLEAQAERALWCLEPGLHAMVARDTLIALVERLRGVAHPGLRPLLAVGEDGEALWASYPLAEPGPQPRVGAVMPLEQVVAWVRAVAAGLDAAHQHGFCHGRLVPADVGLIHGKLVVGGVGLWHDVEPAAAAKAWRALEQFVAPEVRDGAPPTPAADAWSLATCAAALYTGAPDGGRDLERAVAARHPALAQALAGGWSREPERRVAVRDLALRIADVSRVAPPSAPVDPTSATAEQGPFSAAQVSGAIKWAQTAPPGGVRGALQAVSMRPAGGRAPTGEPGGGPDDTGRRARIRPISEAVGRSFPVKPGALGYMAPPRDAAPAPRPWRWVVIAAIALALIGGGIAIAVVASGGAQPAAAVADAAVVLVVDAAVDASIDAPPARACTAAMPAIDAVCIDAHEAPGEGRLPDTGVTWAEARAACIGRGLRLCRANEWRAACAGPGGSAWPYGSVAERGACNTGSRSVIAKAGSFPRCRSAAGVFDLAGNVAEWVDDGTVIGGSAIDGSDGRCGAQARRVAVAARFADVGYRCCGDIQGV